MARTFIRQSTQIANSDIYDDQIAPSEVTYENASTIEEDLNHLRSQIQNILNRDTDTMPPGNWWDNIDAPDALDQGTPRGINKLNEDLHGLERKRVLTSLVNIVDITVPAGQNYVVLSVADEETPGVFGGAVAVGNTTTTGSVAAHHGGAFGTEWSGEVVAGATAISPKNLMMIVTGSNRDPLLYENNIIYGLFQVENSTNGHILNDAGNQAQISFVYVDPVAGDVLLEAPAAAVENQSINYVSTVRKALKDLSEQDFLRGAEIDVPSTSATTRQNAYNNQGDDPVELGTNATLDLGTGLHWEIRDNGDFTLFKIDEGSASDNTTISISSNVDVFDINAGEVDFAEGASFDTSGTQIDIGMNAGVIETTSTNDLKLLGAGELLLSDGNRDGSSWTATSIKLSDDSTEWDEFSTAFGEVSLLKAVSQSRRRPKVYAVVQSDVAADTTVSLTAGNINAELPAMDVGTFGEDYDIYLNGQLLYPGSGNDYYAVTGDANAMKFEFGLKTDDIICVVPYVRS
jgi:hypothetical protein